MKRYYIGDNPDKPRGPYLLDELRGFSERGEIGLDTPVIEEGAASWGRYRDLRTAERTKEVAEAVAERAAKMAAAFQREESRSFGFGFLLGIVHLLTLPWQLIRGAASTVSKWGASRFIAMSEDRLALAAMGKVAKPLLILLWSALWVGDCIGMLFVGRPTVTLRLASLVGDFFLMGMPGANAMDALDFASGFLRIHEFGDRLVWALKIGIIGYFLTVIVAIVGEIFGALAGLRIGAGVQQGRAE